MEIFQKSVVNNHLANLDKEQVEKAFDKFKENYSPAKISEIKKLKEEEYQDGFLREIFVDIFGYTLKPADNYDLAREFKNQTDGKKADGAILKDGKAIVVIELKSTKTKDLKSITEQAFNYKNNQPDCKYVITSNFQKLRFYIDYANEYEEFDLFNLQKQEFELLYLILHKDSIFSDLPLKLKNETKFHEENISDKLYKDYSNYKHKIYNNLVKNNPQYDKLTLFKKSQKFLDRLLFVFFAEDTGLVPPNAISKIVEQWEQLQELDEYKTLYSRFVKFFEHLDKGHKYKTYELPAYNGGLFATDEILDNLIIDDEILKDDALKLSAYDFNTDVDVNILGHIFEHSLGEIEEITAEIEGTAEDKTKSKRKKDGVFYTPKYITQYIVENTIGKLCTEKRAELNITEIEFDGTYKTKDGKLSAKGKKLFKTLDDYKKWLISLKIIDPACGSGAFLNQALLFLIDEHKHIDDIIAELTGEAMRLFDTDKAILENNLYGVDINEESVEIARLSLWLRTAQKGRKLSNLNENIKCGNSLIDDPEIAGDKAFDWHKEFPQIFTEKEKKAWHVTTATHNSRYSQRMFDNHVKTSEAVWLDEEDEIIITKTIAEIVKESKSDNNGNYPIDILEYNICGDHMHLLIVCEKEELTKIVGKIKGITARKRNSNKGINPLVRQNGENAVSLWTQKFGKSEIKDENYLNNVIEYIQNNRIKHELPKNEEIEKLKKEFLCTKEHAFRTEYKGGFDCVIGNPPYFSLSTFNNNIQVELKKNYINADKSSDIYCVFYELGINILKENGLISFITSNQWLQAQYGKVLRDFFVKTTNPIELLNFGGFKVFKDATVDSAIFTTQKNNCKFNLSACLFTNNFNSHQDIRSYIQKNKVTLNNLKDDRWLLVDEKTTQLKNKIKKEKTKLKEHNIEILRGVLTGFNEAFIIDTKKKEELCKNNPENLKIIKPLLRGRDIHRYNINWAGLWLISTLPSMNIDIDKFPAVKTHLLGYGKRLEQSGEKGCRKKTNNKWYETQDTIKYYKKFHEEKIIYPETTVRRSEFYRDKDHFFIDKTAFMIVGENLGYYQSILASKLMQWYLEFDLRSLGKNSIQYSKIFIEKVPIPNANNEIIKLFNEKSDLILLIDKNIQEKKNKFLNRIKDNLVATATDNGASPIDLKLSKKLDAFYEFNFKTLLSELKKKKVVLSLLQQDEWEEYFNAYKTEINNLQTEIDKTDKEIDQMVYQLYELTEEEITIVENSIKGSSKN